MSLTPTGLLNLKTNIHSKMFLEAFGSWLSALVQKLKSIFPNDMTK